MPGFAFGQSGSASYGYLCLLIDELKQAERIERFIRITCRTSYESKMSLAFKTELPSLAETWDLSLYKDQAAYGAAVRT